MSSSNSPCAACKFLRRKCTQECVFAPYFPADQPQRFANVHKVFGASNVTKILNELDKSHREEAVNSLAYEAEFRLRDPVYGCVGVISYLQHNLKQLQINLDLAKKELASLVGPVAMMQMLQTSFLQAQLLPNNGGGSGMVPYNMAHMMGMMPGGPGQGQIMISDHQQQQQHGQMIQHQQHQQPQQQYGHHVQLQEHQNQNGVVDPQQLAAMQVREEQEIMRNFEQQHIHHQLQQQQQQQVLRYNGNGYESTAGGIGEFCQMGTPAPPPELSSPSPLLALGNGFDGNSYQMQPQHEQPLLMLQQPQQSDSEAVQNLNMERQHHQQAEQLFHEHPAGSGNDQGRTPGQAC